MKISVPEFSFETREGYRRLRDLGTDSSLKTRQSLGVHTGLRWRACAMVQNRQTMGKSAEVIMFACYICIAIYITI